MSTNNIVSVSIDAVSKAEEVFYQKAYPSYLNLKAQTYPM